MAGFSISQTEQIGAERSGGGGFFSLKNDRDVARVRLLFNDAEDVRAHSVHEVEVDGKKRWVDCLREYGAPIDDCPFCKAGRYVNFKYFIPLFNIDANTTQVWERGKKFGSKLASICGRYAPVINHTFEIERIGKAGDQQTTYEIYETGDADGSLEDFDFNPNPVGTIILQKSASDMEYYLKNGCFPNNGGNSRNDSADSAPVYQRRTPANNNGSRRVF